MNFDFSDDLKFVRDEARSFLSKRSTSAVVRRVMDGTEGYDLALWNEVAALGWLGTAIPEQYGGVGLSHEGLCVLAGEMGASLAPIPFSSSAYLAAEAILMFGSEAQKQEWLPRLAAGELIGTLALAEGPGNPTAGAVQTTIRRGGGMHGRKIAVPDGMAAGIAVVAARAATGEVGLHLVPLDGAGVVRTPQRTLDPSRGHASLAFDGMASEPLPGAADFDAILHLLDRAAVLFAFEQVGGAQMALDMARDYAMDRIAFGRPVASYQAIKHKLADVYIAIELARSHGFYGAWALESGSVQLRVAAAAARIAATKAYRHATQENIQVHGGMGFTWEFDCHLYYRRAALLGANLGSLPYWTGRLIETLEAENAG